MKGRWLSVRATGEATAAPDMAVVSLAVSASGAELAQVRGDVNERSSAVLTAIRQAGIDESDIDAPDVSIQPEYDYRRGRKLTGYRAAREMSFHVRDLDRLGELLDAVVEAGANEVHGARMRASDPSAAEHAALAAAVEAARAKAEVLARAAGARLGPVVRVEEEADWSGPPEPMARALAMPESTDAPTEVVAGQLAISRRVRVRFLID